jgi:NADH:ubiquinone oxidoreductase subunit K
MMVLFLFVVMVLDVGKERLKEHLHAQSVIAIPILVLLLGIAGYLLFNAKLSAPAGKYAEAALVKQTEVLGKLLYTKYIFPFEVVSVLLLVALIGAIVLVMILRRNILIVLMSLELVFNSANISFAAFSYYLQSLNGMVFVVFSITIAAAEVAVGLAILVAVYRCRKTAYVDELNEMRG